MRRKGQSKCNVKCEWCGKMCKSKGIAVHKKTCKHRPPEGKHLASTPVWTEYHVGFIIRSLRHL